MCTAGFFCRPLTFQSVNFLLAEEVHQFPGNDNMELTYDCQLLAEIFENSFAVILRSGPLQLTAGSCMSVFVCVCSPSATQFSVLEASCEVLI